MKKIVCEMCGNSDLIKEDGVFVCQSCGSKYSVEEAKKMMVEIEGTVKIDNTNAIDNYLAMAKNAFDAENYEETEKYCNKVIELTPSNYEVWFMKGQAVGWTSTLDNIRIPETVNAFSNAIQFCPEDLKEQVASNCEKTLLNLHKALLIHRLKCFKVIPNEANLKDLKNDLNSALLNSLKFLKKTGIYTYTLTLEMGKILNSNLSEIWKNVYSKFISEENGHPSDRALKKFLDEGGNIKEAYIAALLIFGEEAHMPSSVKILTNALEGKDTYTYSDMEVNNLMISIYKNIIVCEEKMRDACSYKWEYISGKKYYTKSLSLADNAVSARNIFIKTYKENIETIEKQNDKLKVKAREKYWQEHAEEKAKLEEDLESINVKIEDAKERIASIEGVNGEILKKIMEEQNVEVPSVKDKVECEKIIYHYEIQYSKLGFFKGKEKKELLEKIEQEKKNLANINDKIKKEKQELSAKVNEKIKEVKSKSKPIYEEIEKLEKEKLNINNELKKDRI